MEYRQLCNIKSPDDIKRLDRAETEELCAEIRDCILNTVSKNGGHLSSNLGSVELTVAMHKVFHSPKDTFVFDVGHQCYAHKLLTGRFSEFSTLRTENGISGFMKPEESVHDPFITGHSSTSISSAYGVNCANELSGDEGYSIAVIGDGALTGGMAYEALINTHKTDKRFIIILNDNKMSISKNRGSLAKHLSKIRTRKKYFRFKSGVEKALIKIPLIGKYLRSIVFHMKLMLKNAIYDSNIFESLGIYYLGPVDGHDVKRLEEAMELAKIIDRPVLIHVKTVKGKGYKPAELNPDIYHGVSGFQIETGEVSKVPKCFSSVFGEELTRLAGTDNKICAVTAAMADGTGLDLFAEKYKNRFFDVGIAEQHAVTFCAALAKKGFKPVFAVYSTFLQRGYDQIIHDAAIAGLPVTLAVDRAGFVGSDGETHQGLFDVAYLSSVPGVKIYAPSDFDELRRMLRERLEKPEGVAAIRYPRGGEPVCPVKFDDTGKEFAVYGTGDAAMITYGTLVAEAAKVVLQLKQDGINVSLVKLNLVNPLSDRLIDTLKAYKNIFFFEEGSLRGGAAEHLGFRLISSGYTGIYKVRAVEGFVKQATVSAQRAAFGLDNSSMIRIIKEGNGFD